ncbi:hypothetical protein A0H81_03574 [Grifola frondosa]|uniref:Uncharacterized protein n=1 Tax=Grifola frondosa TaxID=5627 RepID=A0A1C7MII4_GRIFR|nr:hypothetical protein A0H81_03574 [Grifola frondosa]
MTTLPSFVELMASLGLGNSTDSPDSSSAPRHSRTSSQSSTTSSVSQASDTVIPSQANIYSITSPSIVVSSPEVSPDRESDWERRRTRIARYSPYCTAISHARKGSMPSVITEEEAVLNRPARAMSTSPRLSSISRNTDRRSRPIASVTPQSSPISPTFPHSVRKRSSTPSLPLSIPTLPPIFSIPSFKNNNSDTEDEDMDTMSELSSFQLEQPAQVVSSPRHGTRAISIRSHALAPHLKITIGTASHR